MTSPARLAVFASGRGTNLQALLQHFNATGHPVARVELVVANRPGIGALDRAEAADVPTTIVDPAGADAATILLASLAAHRIDLIVLAGYLKLVPAAVVSHYAERMINIHPALLPSFGGPGMYGLRVHDAVLASGARVTGPTIHLVGDRYDEGPILAQWPVPVLPDDTPQSLAARVLAVEHLLLPAAIEFLLAPPAPRHTVSEMAFALSDRACPDSESVRRLLR